MINRFPRRFLPFMLMLAMLAAAAAPAWATTLEEEIELGKKIDEQILKDYPLTDDEQALKEINDYGQKLVKGVRRPEIKYHFRIIQDDEFNAFSVPGGYVYFTDHLWNVLRKDERIGVLAHEIVHVDGRHAIDAISKQQRRQLWLTALLAVLGANQTWGNIAGLAESLYTLNYSRGDEQQADEFGAELAQQAGYNPAGILLAMRKIKRFQDESGGQPPKIFSSHPPTDERLHYLEALLTKMGTPIPAENVQRESRPYKVGEVSSVDRDRVQFNSSKQLEKGDVVWLMTDGWDYYYEKKVPVPSARGVVREASQTVTAEIWPMDTAKKRIEKGAGVYAPPIPQITGDVGKVAEISHSGDSVGKLVSDAKLNKLDRLLAQQAVWNDDQTQLIVDNVGYVVVTNPSSESGYVGLTRQKYSYAPVAADSTLVRLKDPDQDRWVGPIISIGRGGHTIEVLPNRTLERGKTYEVAYPLWNEAEGYRKRVVGTAALYSTTGKIVLKVTDFKIGRSMDDIRNGFDVYEAVEEQAADGQ